MVDGSLTESFRTTQIHIKSASFLEASLFAVSQRIDLSNSFVESRTLTLESNVSETRVSIVSIMAEGDLTASFRNT
jgi:hypothetical protein